MNRPSPATLPAVTRIGLSDTFAPAAAHVFEAEQAGSFARVFRAIGRSCGRALAQEMDREGSAHGASALPKLALEVSLARFAAELATRGLGKISFDLAGAPRGVVIARLEHGLGEDSSAGSAEDPLMCGLLAGFFECLSGETLDCLQLDAAPAPAPAITFAVATPDRIAALAPHVGREPAEKLLRRLTT